MATTVPMLAPDGSSGDIPQAKMQDAMKAGFKPAVEMTSPDGKPGYIPQDRMQDAMKAGFKPTPQATQQPGFWENLGHTFGIGAQEGEQRRQDLLQHPVRTLAENALGPVYQAGKSAVGGFMRSTGEAGQAIDALRQGNPAAAGVHAVTAVPIVGPALNRMADEAPATTPGQSYLSQVRSAATPGNMGTALGTAAQVAPMVLGAADSIAPGRPVVPNDLPKKVVGRAVLLGNTPEGAYQSALKPSTTLSATEKAAAVKTGLDNAIPVSPAGVEKISNLIEDLNQKVSDTIQSAGPNRTINPATAVKNLQGTRAKFANQVNPQSDLSAIDASGDQFLDQFRSQPGGAVRNMSAADAQAMKQGTYRVLAGKFGEQGSAAVEAQKALARGLKEEIASQFPEIGILNAAESKLLDLQPVLERAVNRISNHQLVGIGTPVTGAATKAVTGSGAVGGVSMVLKAVLDNPGVKSRLAIAVSKASKTPYSQALSRVDTYATSLGLAAAAQQGNSTGDNPNQPATQQP